MIAMCDGIEIGYDDAGSGLPVVFLHGFPHNRSLWTPQRLALTERARCIIPDLRGFGASSIEGPYSIDRYADDLAALLDVLRVPQAVVCGLSMGGYVALAFWRRHRDRVRALGLLDTRAGADSAEGVAKRREMIALAHAKGSGAIAAAMLPGMVGKSTREKCPEIVDAVHRMLESAPVEGIVGALESLMTRADSFPTLPTIDVPTLIVVGDEDVLTPPSEARALHAGIRGSRLEVITGAGHVANLERPAAVNHVLTEFLGALTFS